MPPLGFGRKDEQLPSNLTTDAAITDKDDLEEIEKIRHTLNPNEEVFVVARFHTARIVAVLLVKLLFSLGL